MVKKSFIKGGAQPKRNQKAQPEGCVSRDVTPLLTPSQAEIYALLVAEGLSVSQIATRRKCSKQYVRKIRGELAKSGLYRNLMVAPPQDPATPATKSATNDRRLHAQKFRIELINPVSEKYLKESVGKCLRIDGNPVQCFEGIITVQASDKSFLGKSEEEALASSMEYWYHFFARLENDLHVLILKDRKQNITMTYHEWATGPCDLAEECEKRGDPIRIFSQDGKLRYTTDWSHLHEREAHHHRTGMQDSETGNRFIEDVLDHPSLPTYSQICSLVKNIAIHNAEMAAGLNAVVQLLKGPDARPIQKNEEVEYIG